VASGSGWGRDTTHHPKAEEVVTVARTEEVVAVGATGEDLVDEPGPAAQHTPAGRFDNFPAIPAIVGVVSIKTTGPFPDIAAEVGYAFRAVAIRENTHRVRAAQMAFKGIAACRIKQVTPRVNPGLPAVRQAARRSLPLGLGREPIGLSGLRRQPSTIGPRLMPTDTHHWLGWGIVGRVVPIAGLGLPTRRIPLFQLGLKISIGGGAEELPILQVRACNEA